MILIIGVERRIHVKLDMNTKKRLVLEHKWWVILPYFINQILMKQVTYKLHTHTHIYSPSLVSGYYNKKNQNNAYEELLK